MQLEQEQQILTLILLDYIAYNYSFLIINIYITKLKKEET